jgi:hypothetical protein
VCADDGGGDAEHADMGMMGLLNVKTCVASLR